MENFQKTIFELPSALDSCALFFHTMDIGYELFMSKVWTLDEWRLFIDKIVILAKKTKFVLYLHIDKNYSIDFVSLLDLSFLRLRRGPRDTKIWDLFIFFQLFLIRFIWNFQNNLLAYDELQHWSKFCGAG
jgi:hypothetical protein